MTKSLLACSRTLICGVLCLLAVNISVAQKKNVVGVVRSSNGQPISGVTVKINNANGSSVQTASNGEFQLMLDVPSTLIFSSIGFSDTKRMVEPGETGEVILNEAVSELEDVVVVGYGTQRRSNVTGAVAYLDGKELLKRPVMRASSALQGLAAGVTVTQSSGKPGADGGTIRIRGIGTLGDSNPLVLIDGVNGSLDGVDPNDIESISVLKDAASASIYGSRAANGVILVTTKKGKEGKVALSYEGFVGKQSFTDLPEM